MKPRRKSSQGAKRPKAAATPAAPRLTTRRRWLFAVMALILAPLLAFAVLEGGLRVAGYGYDTSFFKKVRINDEDFLVNNDNFVLRFFPPQLARLPGALRMEAEKPAHTCRIFILGESAALGDPSPPYGAGRYLQALLSARFPDEKFEVVNVSITAINSHTILPIARECAQHQGDFWIIYMGNNEMVGPFGAASVFGAKAPPLWVVRLSLGLQQTRSGQWLMAMTRRLHFQSSSHAAWNGMEMFLGNQLPPDDRRKETVYHNFERNLHDILQAGTDSGARVILNTVAVNLKDSPPFASISNGGLSAGDRAREEHFSAAAANALQAGQTNEAAQDFAQAAKLLPLSADLQYGWAQCLTGAEARAHYQKACDYDALPFRTDSRENEIIRQSVRAPASSNLFLFDAAAALAADNPLGVCGEETFFEHVHFNFDGNYRLGLAWAQQIAPLFRQSATNDWLAQEPCEQRLALTDRNRIQTLNEVMRRRHQPPLDSQSNNVAEAAKLWSELGELHRHTDAASAATARALYLEDIARDPQDYLLRFNYADFLEAIGDWRSGVALWKEVQALLPEYYLPYFQEARLLEHAGQLADASALFHQTVELYPRMTVAWFELSNIDASQGNYETALAECERARDLEPGQPAFYTCVGRVLSRMNRHAEALEQFRKAVQIQPSYVEGHIALGQELNQQGLRDEARQQFRQALQLDPNNKAARENLGAP